MFHLCPRPTRFGLALGLAVIALWAAAWILVLAELSSSGRSAARQPGEVPELARVESSGRGARA